MHDIMRKHRILLLASLIIALAALSSTFAAAAKADLVGPITFEPSQGYLPGNIDGQQGWKKTGLFDVQVASLAAYPLAPAFGFGTQALRVSDAVTSQGFG